MDLDGWLSSQWEAHVAWQDKEFARRVDWCVRHDIDPFASCADGGCEAWMLVTDKELEDDERRINVPVVTEDAPDVEY